MQRYYNQRVVKIVNREKNALYGKVYIDDVAKASQLLGEAAFKLWIYFSLNRDGYTFALSKIDVQNRTGISKNSYFRALKELEGNGYLLFNGDDTWVFQGSAQKESSSHNGCTQFECNSNDDKPILSTTLPKSGTAYTQNGDTPVPNLGMSSPKIETSNITDNINKIIQDTTKDKTSLESFRFEIGDILPNHDDITFLDDELKDTFLNNSYDNRYITNAHTQMLLNNALVAKTLAVKASYIKNILSVRQEDAE